MSVSERIKMLQQPIPESPAHPSSPAPVHRRPLREGGTTSWATSISDEAQRNNFTSPSLPRSSPSVRKNLSHNTTNIPTILGASPRKLGFPKDDEDRNKDEMKFLDNQNENETPKTKRNTNFQNFHHRSTASSPSIAQSQSQCSGGMDWQKVVLRKSSHNSVQKTPMKESSIILGASPQKIVFPKDDVSKKMNEIKLLDDHNENEALESEPTTDLPKTHTVSTTFSPLAVNSKSSEGMDWQKVVLRKSSHNSAQKTPMKESSNILGASPQKLTFPKDGVNDF